MRILFFMRESDDKTINIYRGGAAVGAVCHGEPVYRTGQGDCGITGREERPVGENIIFGGGNCETR